MVVAGHSKELAKANNDKVKDKANFTTKEVEEEAEAEDLDGETTTSHNETEIPQSRYGQVGR